MKSIKFQTIDKLYGSGKGHHIMCFSRIFTCVFMLIIGKVILERVKACQTGSEIVACRVTASRRG